MRKCTSGGAPGSCVIEIFYILVSSFGYWRCLLGLCYKWLLSQIHVWMPAFCGTVLFLIPHTKFPSLQVSLLWVWGKEGYISAMMKITITNICVSECLSSGSLYETATLLSSYREVVIAHILAQCTL